MTRAVSSRRARRHAAGSAARGRRSSAPRPWRELGTSLLYNLVTVIVTERFGNATGAQFFMAWQAVTVVDLSATFFMNSLAVGRRPRAAAARPSSPPPPASGC